MAGNVAFFAIFMVLLPGLAAAIGTRYLLLGWHYANHAEPRCPKCEYDLRGNSSHLCPECGTTSTPTEVANAAHRRQRNVIVRGAFVLVVTLLYLPAVTLVILMNRDAGRRSLVSPLGTGS